VTRGRARAARLVLSLALACAPALEPGPPVLLAVNPSRASAGAAVRVEISGRDLDAQVKADFNDVDRRGLDAAFSAWLEPSEAGSAVALQDVALKDRRTLLATVPAGVAAGTYRLVVVDPAGRAGALERAYHVVPAAGDVARFEVILGRAPTVNIPLDVTVTALDAGGAVVEAFDGTVTLSDSAGTLAPRPHGPFVRGRASGRVALPTLVAADTLTVSDAAGRTGASSPFDVVAGPPAALVFTSAPAIAAAGACSPRVDLALRDATGAAAVAGAPVAVELQGSPADVVFYADAACTTPLASVAIPAGRGAGAFWFLAASAGEVSVRAVAAGLPSVIQLEAVTR
jgi:hypothetical protein